MPAPQAHGLEAVGGPMEFNVAFVLGLIAIGLLTYLGWSMTKR